MRKFLTGVFFTLTIGCLAFYWPTIKGKRSFHRQNGVIEVNQHNPNNFIAIDPTTRVLVKKNLNIYTSPTYYFDRKEGESQYVTWKSDNIFDYDAVYHLSKNHTKDFRSMTEIVITSVFFSSLIGLGLLYLLLLAVFGRSDYY